MSQEARTETVVIGSPLAGQFEASLPLSPAEDFIATDAQRNDIGREALDGILAENPSNSMLGFSQLRGEIMKRTGLDDAAASLFLYGRRDLENC
jgi:hypothetical protein